MQPIYSQYNPLSRVHSTVVVDDFSQATVISTLLAEDIEAVEDQCELERSIWRRLSSRQREIASRFGRLVSHVPALIWSQWRREWDTKFRSYMTWQEYEVNKLNSAEFTRFRCQDEPIEMPVSAKARAMDQVSDPVFSRHAIDSISATG